MARMKDLLLDATNAGMIEPEPQFVDPATCPHPSARLYAWHAHDDVLVVACCDCGKVLQGEARKESEPDIASALEHCRHAIGVLGDMLGVDQSFKASDIREALDAVEDAVEIMVGA